METCAWLCKEPHSSVWSADTVEAGNDLLIACGYTVEPLVRRADAEALEGALIAEQEHVLELEGVVERLSAALEVARLYVTGSPTILERDDDADCALVDSALARAKP